MSRFSCRCSVPTALVVLGMMISIPALQGVGQTRSIRKPDPQTQLLNNYRKYPDRYIRISGESWKYDDSNLTALHSFTLKNIAGVAYSGIEIRASYLDANGKLLYKEVLRCPGILAAYQIRKIKGIKVKNVPLACEQALLAVITASIHP